MHFRYTAMAYRKCMITAKELVGAYRKCMITAKTTNPAVIMHFRCAAAGGSAGWPGLAD